MSENLDFACRECGLQFSGTASDDAEICAVCLEKTCNVAAEGILSVNPCILLLLVFLVFKSLHCYCYLYCKNWMELID